MTSHRSVTCTGFTYNYVSLCSTFANNWSGKVKQDGNNVERGIHLYPPKCSLQCHQILKLSGSPPELVFYWTEFQHEKIMRTVSTVFLVLWDNRRLMQPAYHVNYYFSQGKEPRDWFSKQIDCFRLLGIVASDCKQSNSSRVSSPNYKLIS